MTSGQTSIFDAPASSMAGDFSERSRPAARYSDEETSRDAAARVGGGAEALALAAFVQYGPMADFELVERCANVAAGDTVKSARSRLKRDGYVVKTGERRKTPRRRWADVYGLADS